LLSAGAITIIICLMVVLKIPTARALVYSLPIPITIALIDTGAHVDSFNVIGIALLGAFLLGMLLLHGQLGWNIVLVDVLLATAYVLAAYLLSRLISPSFAVAAVAYGALWILVMLKLNALEPLPPGPTNRRAPIWVKAILVFGMAYALLSLRRYFAAFVVTFPYSGVFAVYEGRTMLPLLAATFFRNSLAILALFAAVVSLRPYTAEWAALLIGWGAFVAVYGLVAWRFPLGNFSGPAPPSTGPGDPGPS
jgi:hypothetical protein